MNRATTSASGTGTTIRLTRAARTNTITVRAVPWLWDVRRPDGTSVNNPARYAAHVFRVDLGKQGISFGGGTTDGTMPSAVTNVATDSSAPLSQIVVPLLKLSVNGCAEQIFKTLGRVDGTSGTWAAGAKTVKAWLSTTSASTTAW